MKIPISIVYEDDLSGCLLRKLLKNNFEISAEYNKHGFGDIKKKIFGYNQAALHSYFLVLTDLDTAECAPGLINDWLPDKKQSNLIFRVAVKEIESWILADRENFAAFLGISSDHIPFQCDNIQNPKELLMNLVRKSRKRSLKEDILPRYDGDRIGPYYNGCLSNFINNSWDIKTAVHNSESLLKAYKAIKKLAGNS